MEQRVGVTKRVADFWLPDEPIWGFGSHLWIEPKEPPFRLGTDSTEILQNFGESLLQQKRFWDLKNPKTSTSPGRRLSNATTASVGAVLKGAGFGS